MDYLKYKQSRDLSWQILIDHNIRELPVKVSNICRAMNLKIIDFEKGKPIISSMNLQNHTQENDGFTFGKVIFYNNRCSIARQRFTIAHELGHCLLHNGNGLYNREPSAKDNPIEHEANIFASRLLAPACVLWGLGVTKAEQISSICDISITSAKFRMERLNILYERNKFLISPTEQQLYEQFKSYISMNKLL